MTGGAGGRGTGGRVATGGAASGGAGLGTGGIAGGPGTGGISIGTGGISIGTGGISIGTGGAGGAPAMCSPNATQCSGADLQTCGSNGQWGGATSCGAHRACTGSMGTAKCACMTDPDCKSTAKTCSGTTALVTCAMDGNGCFYQASSMVCSNGACSGSACCTNACTAAAMQSSGCGPQTCQMGTNGCLAWSTASCSGTLVCERYSGPVCADPNWAEWPIPPDSPNSFTDNGDGTITDTVTKLMWQKAQAPMMYTQSAAVAYCQTVTLGGHTDWRVPAVVELFSIVDHAVYQREAINAIFTPTPGLILDYWTSTVSTYTSSSAWVVRFYLSDVNESDLTTMNNVRCVR